MYVRFFAFSIKALSSGLNRLRFESNSESSELNELLEQTIAYKGLGDTNVVTHDHMTIGEATNDKLEPTIDQ